LIFETIFWTAYLPFIVLMLALLGSSAMRSLRRLRSAPSMQSRQPQNGAHTRQWREDPWV